MIISWIAKKKIIYAIGFLLVLSMPIALIVWQNWPKPSCSDAKLNQGEEDIDCGGPCLPCISKPVNLITHWVRSFKITDGQYDLSALVENPNTDYGIRSLDYEFKVYNTKNILIGQKKGSTFVNPQERFIVFETGMDVGFGIPARTFLELNNNDDYSAKWEYLKKDKVSVAVVSKKFTNEPFARLEIKIKNNLLSDIVNLVAGGVLLDKNNNAIASSAITIDIIGGDETYVLTLTWPDPFLEPVVFDEVYLRTNLFK